MEENEKTENVQTDEPVAEGAPAPEAAEEVAAPAPETAEEAAEEVAAAVAPACEEPEEEPAAGLSEEELQKLKTQIDTHFVRLVEFIKYNKSKDANVLQLTKELQQYRNGYELNLFKGFAMNVIAYREECVRTVKSFGSHSLTKAEGGKYLGYAVQDFEDLLQNLGIEDGDVILYNGKPVDAPPKKTEFGEIPEYVPRPLPDMEVKDLESLFAYFKACEEAFSLSLQDNAALDVLLGSYIKAAESYEQGIAEVVLYPVVREVVSAYRMLEEDAHARTQTLTDENAQEVYLGCIARMAEESEKILTLCGVTIDSFVSETFDPKQQRILKLVPTDDAALGGKVAVRHTDAYTLADKIIYPSKVDVYKFNEK